MARSEARITTELWDSDDDFAKLTRRQQGTYMYLLSQSDLAHDGVMPLRERRWANAAADYTYDELMADLDALAAARYIVIDDRTGELLIRSLIRRDNVYRQPNVLKAAATHLRTVKSGVIKAVIAEELLRIAGSGDVHEASVPILVGMFAFLGVASPFADPNPSRKGSLKGSPKGSRKTKPKPSADPSGIPTAATQGERGVVTAVTTDAPSPVPLSTFPVPPAPNSAPPVPPTPDGVGPPETAQTILATWIDYCAKADVKLPKQIIGQYAKGIDSALKDGFSPKLIRNALASMRADNVTNRPSLLANRLVAAQTGPEKRPTATASEPTLHEPTGLHLTPRTAARVDGRKRFEALDHAGGGNPLLGLTAPAIEGRTA